MLYIVKKDKKSKCCMFFSFAIDNSFANFIRILSFSLYKGSLGD